MTFYWVSAILSIFKPPVSSSLLHPVSLLPRVSTLLPWPPTLTTNLGWQGLLQLPWWRCWRATAHNAHRIETPLALFTKMESWTLSSPLNTEFSTSAFLILPRLVGVLSFYPFWTFYCQGCSWSCLCSFTSFHISYSPPQSAPLTPRLS